MLSRIVFGSVRRSALHAAAPRLSALVVAPRAGLQVIDLRPRMRNLHRQSLQLRASGASASQAHAQTHSTSRVVRPAGCHGHGKPAIFATGPAYRPSPCEPSAHVVPM